MYKKTILPNGIRVVTEKIPHVRSVSIGVWVDVGSRNENTVNNGISHFVEHMVFKGTKRYKVHEIAQSLEKVGGYLNAFTTKEHTCYYARILDEHLPLAIDVLADMSQFPIFNKKEMEKEKLVVLEEIKNLEDSPDELIYDYFDQSLYGKHPLGMPIIGTPENIMNFSPDTLFGYLHSHYVPSKMVVAAAGNFEHETLLKMVEALFQHQPNKKEKPSSNRLSKQKSETRTYEKPITQAHVCLGTQGFSMKHKQRYPLLVLNTLLGEGMSSRLFQTLREKHGMAYTVYSFANFLSDAGNFGVYIGTDAEKVDKAIDLIKRELDKLATKTVTSAELKRTKAQLKGSMMLSLENTSNRMMRLGSGELYVGEYIPLDEIVRRIDSVTQEQILEVAQQLFRLDTFSTITLKPKNGTA
ncbi:MAG: insulinase family protein [Ignavibacteriae bacterium]|nr:insulinase family protein [Ignavibacteriota bacterium]